jgi:uncharacterized protein (TIGR02646 family)
MRKLTRGARPAALDGIKNGQTERDRARQHFVNDNKVDGFSFEAYGHADVRRALNAMTGGSCAYCEAMYAVTAPVDVEHHRPKGRIDTPAGKRVPGYWWLAAVWENLLPSCIHCNRIQHDQFPDGSSIRSGKGDQFPLNDEAARGTSEDSEVGEIGLLINPCVDEPSDLLRFVDDRARSIVKGVVEDTTQLSGRRARASIDIYGLNRPDLVHHRSTDMQRIKQSLKVIRYFIRELEHAEGEKARELELLFQDEIGFLRGHVTGATGFSAMARTLVEPAFAALGLRL